MTTVRVNVVASKKMKHYQNRQIITVDSTDPFSEAGIDIVTKSGKTGKILLNKFIVYVPNDELIPVGWVSLRSDPTHDPRLSYVLPWEEQRLKMS